MWLLQLMFLTIANCQEPPPRYAEEWAHWEATNLIATQTFRPSFISCSAVCNKLEDGCSVFKYSSAQGGLCRVGRHVETIGLTDMLDLGKPELLFVKRNMSEIETGTSRTNGNLICLGSIEVLECYF